MPKNEKRQIRGEQLRRRIEAVIREHHAQSIKEEKEYVYNATQVANSVPTTRKTLAKHDDLIETVLKDLESRRRMSTGDATAEFLREQIDRLKEKINEKDKIIAALRDHHLAIYETLHLNSITGKELIRPILEAESEQAGECILCGPSNSEKDSNVVSIKGKK